mgnify:CR=1 FL=1
MSTNPAQHLIERLSEYYGSPAQKGQGEAVISVWLESLSRFSEETLRQTSARVFDEWEQARFPSLPFVVKIAFTVSDPPATT